MASERRLTRGMDEALKTWDFYKIAKITMGEKE